jgi:hypothetical protein
VVNRLEPVSFVYTDGNGRVADDTAAIDGHLATYDSTGPVSGIDHRSVLPIVEGAIKDSGRKSSRPSKATRLRTPHPAIG